jgi:hypothetical protein
MASKSFLKASSKIQNANVRKEHFEKAVYKIAQIERTDWLNTLSTSENTSISHLNNTNSNFIVIIASAFCLALIIILFYFCFHPIKNFIRSQLNAYRARNQEEERQAVQREKEDRKKKREETTNQANREIDQIMNSDYSNKKVVITEEKREKLENSFKILLQNNLEETEDDKAEKLEDFAKSEALDEEKGIEKKKSYISHTLVEGMIYYLDCEEERGEEIKYLERPEVAGGNYKKARNKDESEGDQFTLSLPTEIPFIPFKETQYFKIKGEYNEMSPYELMLSYKEVENDLLDIFKHEEEEKSFYYLEPTCKAISKIFKKYGNKSAEEKYEKEIQEIQEISGAPLDSEYLMHKKKCFNTITALWSSDTNLFRWINKVLFLDVVKLVLKKDETPKYFEKAFPGCDLNFYETVLKKSARFMALLNLYISQEADIGKKESLFRGINCTALKHAEPGEKYCFIQYSASSSNFKAAVGF